MNPIDEQITLAGCSSSSPDDGTFDEEDPQTHVNNGHAGGHVGSGVGVYAASRLLSRGVGGGGSVGTAPSARSGFGSFGGISSSS
jgi:hypothetical protein